MLFLLYLRISYFRFTFTDKIVFNIVRIHPLTGIASLTQGKVLIFRINDGQFSFYMHH